MNHRSPVQPLKSFLPFHPMLPGMFFLVPTARASLLTQGSAGASSHVGAAESVTVNFGPANRVASPTTPSPANQATATAWPAGPGR